MKKTLSGDLRAYFSNGRPETSSAISEIRCKWKSKFIRISHENDVFIYEGHMQKYSISKYVLLCIPNFATYYLLPLLLSITMHKRTRLDDFL